MSQAAPSPPAPTSPAASPQQCGASYGLPTHIVAWIEQETGARIVSVALRTGGGASREGAFVDLSYPDGKGRSCYLTYDLRPGNSSDRLAGFAAEASVIAAVKSHGVRVPGMVAWDAALQVMLTDRVPGDPSFNNLKSPVERAQVAEDFMSQLARLHAIDPIALPLQGFPAMAPASHYIRTRLAVLLAKHAEGAKDPLHVFTLRWLQDHLPPDPPRTVLVHGDAGPANFMHREGQVTALLDWEMAHFGDPMEDMGWIAVRNLFLDFEPFAFLFEAYERAGGCKVDVRKVHYHRVYALACLTIDAHADLKRGSGHFAGILGNNLNFYTVHCRAAVEGMAQAVGLALLPLEITARTASSNARSYQVVLDELRTLILPRVPDELAAYRIKSLARVVKYWQQLDGYGAAFEQNEVTDTNAALGSHHTDIAAARAALVCAIEERALSDASVLQLLHRRVQRDHYLMAPAMGAFGTRRFATLPT